MTNPFASVGPHLISGGSQAPRALIEQYLRELNIPIVQRLGLQRADVLGYSWGLLAQQLAAQHPTVVRRLVLACTGLGLLGIPTDVRVAVRLLTPRRYYSADYLAKIAPDTYGGRFRHDPTFVAAEVTRRMAHPPSWTGYALQLVAAATFSTIPLAPRIRTTTLIIAGDDDPIVNTKNQYLLHRLLPNSALSIIEGGGHLLLLDSPDTSAPVIHSFLSAR